MNPRALAAIASAEAVFGWQVASHVLVTPSSVLAFAAMSLAAVVITLLAQAAWIAGALGSGLLPGRVAALRRKSWGAVFQRQLDPDAAGHPRPRAPSAAPAAA